MRKAQKAIADAVAADQEETIRTMQDSWIKDLEDFYVDLDSKLWGEVNRAAKMIEAAEDSTAKLQAELDEAITAKTMADANIEAAEKSRARLQAELDEAIMAKTMLEEKLQHVEEEAVGEPDRSDAPGQSTAPQRQRVAPPLNLDGLQDWKDMANVILMARIKPVPEMTNTVPRRGMVKQTPATDNEGPEVWGEISVRRNALQQAALTVSTSEPSARPTGQARPKATTVKFTRVFGPECNNSEIFEALKPILPAYKHGYRIVFVADGLSGAGKTHTFVKCKTDRPLIPRTVDWIIQQALTDSGTCPAWLKLTAVQYYQNKPSDLVAMYNDRAGEKKHAGAITAETQKLLREKHEKLYKPSEETTLDIDLDGRLPAVAQICEELDLVRQGRATKMNEASSRGHLVMTIQIEGCTGLFVFVDLCGSEDPGTSDRKTLDEWKPIVQDRQALKEVLLTLDPSKKSTHTTVPTNFSKSIRKLLCDEKGLPRGKLRLAMLTHLIPGQAALNLRLLNDVPRLERSKIGSVEEEAEVTEESVDTDPQVD